jgi:hypothetical protein
VSGARSDEPGQTKTIGFDETGRTETNGGGMVNPFNESGGPDPTRPSMQARMQSVAGALPPEILAVVALLCVGSLFLIIPALDAAPDGFGALDEGQFGRAFGALILMGVSVLLYFGAALLGLAKLVYSGDRVGRALTVAVASAVTISILFVERRSGWENLTALCAAAIACALTLMPNAKAFFAASQRSAEPVSVGAARTLVVALAGLFGLVGVMLLPVSSLKGKYAVFGVAIVAVAVASYASSRRLTAADTQARLLISGLMAAYAVLTVAAELGTTQVVLPLGVAVAVVCLLWLAPDAREFFGDRPLNMPEAFAGLTSGGGGAGSSGWGAANPTPPGVGPLSSPRPAWSDAPAPPSPSAPAPAGWQPPEWNEPTVAAYPPGLGQVAAAAEAFSRGATQASYQNLTNALTALRSADGSRWANNVPANVAVAAERFLAEVERRESVDTVLRLAEVLANEARQSG